MRLAHRVAACALVAAASPAAAQDTTAADEAAMAAAEAAMDAAAEDWDWELDSKRYGDPGLDGETRYEGEEILTLDGRVVKYRLEPSGEDELEIEGANVTLTNMVTGQSRFVLPQGSDQLIFNWATLDVPRPCEDGSFEQATVAYVALVGTKQDYADGRLDLIIGRFSDLEQVTLAERLRFVDSADTIDRDTVTLIAWDGPDTAEFIKVRLSDFVITGRNRIRLPVPQSITVVDIE